MTWLLKEFIIHVIQRTHCKHHLWVDLLTYFSISCVSIIDQSHPNLSGVREDFRFLVLWSNAAWSHAGSLRSWSGVFQHPSSLGFISLMKLLQHRLKVTSFRSRMKHKNPVSTNSSVQFVTACILCCFLWLKPGLVPLLLGCHKLIWWIFSSCAVT